MRRFSVRRPGATVGSSIRKSLGSLTMKRRSSPVGHAVEEELGGELKGVPVLFLEDLRRSIEEGSVSKSLKLFLAKCNISAEIRRGMTFELLGEDEDGQLLGRGPFRSETFTFVEEEAREKPRSEWTVQDISDFVVSSNSFESMALKCGRKGYKQGKPYQGAFVCHAGESNFADLVDSLLDHFSTRSKPLSKQQVYLHLFNQHGRIMETSVLMKERNLLHQGVKVAMSRFEELIVFMNTWANPFPIRRARCLWEMYNMAAAKRSINLLFVRKASTVLLEVLQTDFESIHPGCTSIDMKSALCTNEVHLGFIHQAVEKLDGGFEHLDAVCGRMVSTWLVENTKDAVIEFRQNEGMDIVKTGQTESCAAMLTHAGRLMDELGQPVIAVRYYREALRLLKSLGGSDIVIAAIYGNMANVLNSLADYDRALSCYGQALARFTKGSNNSNGQFDEQIARTLNSMGEILVELGEIDQANIYFEQSLEIFKRVHGPSDLSVALVLHNIAEVEIRQAKYKEALVKLEKAMDIRVDKLGKKTPEVADTLRSIGLLYAAQGMIEESLQWLKKALNIHRDLKLYEELVQLLVTIATVYSDSKDNENAIKALREALAIGRMHLGDRHPLVASAMLQVGQLYEAQSPQKAVRIYGQALGIIKATAPNGQLSPAFAMALLSSASALEQEGNLELATERVREAVEIYTVTLGEDHRQTTLAQERLERLVNRTL